MCMQSYVARDDLHAEYLKKVHFYKDNPECHRLKKEWKCDDCGQIFDRLQRLEEHKIGRESLIYNHMRLCTCLRSVIEQLFGALSQVKLERKSNRILHQRLYPFQEKMFSHRIHPRYLHGPSKAIATRLGLRDNFVKLPLIVINWLSAAAIFSKSHKPFKTSYLDAISRRNIAKKILGRLNLPNVFLHMKFKPNLRRCVCIYLITCSNDLDFLQCIIQVS